MKNVSMIESSINSNKIWKIINNEGKEFISFNIFSKLLFKKYSENTRFSYSRSITIYIDFLEEAELKGLRRCGICPFAIRSIEHLPAIAVKKDKLWKHWKKLKLD